MDLSELILFRIDGNNWDVYIKPFHWRFLWTFTSNNRGHYEIKRLHLLCFEIYWEWRVKKKHA